MSFPEHKTKSNDETASAFLWLATVGRDQLLYGCLVYGAETSSAISKEREKDTVDCDGEAVTWSQHLISNAAAEQLKRDVEQSSALDLTEFGGPLVRFVATHQALAELVGRKARPTESHLSDQQPGLTEKGWERAIILLKDELGIDAADTPHRIGTFEFFDHDACFRAQEIIEFSVYRQADEAGQAYPSKFRLKRRAPDSDVASVHVELQLSGEDVFSKLIDVSELESKWFDAVPFSSFRMSVFATDGRLIERQAYPFLLSIGLNMAMVGNEYRVDDQLAISASALGPQRVEQTAVVRTKRTNRSVIGVSTEIFQQHRKSMQSRVSRAQGGLGHDRWFGRALEAQLDVIDHFNRLIDGGRIRSAVIVDPYFSSASLKRVVTRLESLDVDLRVVMSLGDKVPDTNQSSKMLINELEQELIALKNSGFHNAAQNLTVVNLRIGNGQAFHDRYLRLETHEAGDEVYMLSNSLNAMSANWPFCMSKLDEQTAHQAAEYIDGLTQGVDNSRSAQPTISFQWP